MLFSWVLFRAENLTAARHYFRRHVRPGPAAATAPLLAADLYTPYPWSCWRSAPCWCSSPLQAHDWAQRPLTWPRVAVLIPLFVFSLLVMFSQAFNPFLYFQF